MQLKFLSGFVAAGLLALCARPILSQTVPAATQGSLPLQIGIGFSNYNVDYGGAKLDGPAIWINWRPAMIPKLPKGLALEAEATDSSIPKAAHPPSFREDSAGGGLIYKWPAGGNYHIYGKGLMGLGSVDFDSGIPSYTHSTRTFYGFGGGLDYRVRGHFWLRADYEMQRWGLLLGAPLNPSGTTIGVLYDFKTPRRF